MSFQTQNVLLAQAIKFAWRTHNFVIQATLSCAFSLFYLQCTFGSLLLSISLFFIAYFVSIYYSLFLTLSFHTQNEVFVYLKYLSCPRQLVFGGFSSYLRPNRHEGVKTPASIITWVIKLHPKTKNNLGVSLNYCLKQIDENTINRFWIQFNYETMERKVYLITW